MAMWAKAKGFRISGMLGEWKRCTSVCVVTLGEKGEDVLVFSQFREASDNTNLFDIIWMWKGTATRFILNAGKKKKHLQMPGIDVKLQKCNVNDFRYKWSMGVDQECCENIWHIRSHFWQF